MSNKKIVHTYMYFKRRVKHKVLQGIDEGVKTFKYNKNIKISFGNRD